MQECRGKLDAAALRIFACVIMAIDHIGLVFFSSELWIRVIGRLAFPIFAFQIAQGAIHTGNIRKYALRLLAFALLSEIPFDLMISGGIVYPYAQNVMFTLLLGLLCCGCVTKMQESGISPSGFIACVLFLLFAWMGELLGTDYGTAGILTVVLFYLVHGKRYGFVLEIIGMLFLHGVWLKGASIRIDILLFTVSVPCQVFAVLAMVPIGMYNGKQGALSKGVRRIFYFFYPLHMLILFAAGLMI